MDNNQIVKRIIVASPSDVRTERKRIDGVVQEINNSLENNLNVRFDVIKWETHAHPSMGRPQQVVNQQLTIEKCDLFIGVIWKRFGTPTGGESQDGIKYESGTEEEFHIAYESWKKTKQPQIMFFRSTKRGSPKDFEAEQLNKVDSFFKEFSYDKAHPGLYREYGSTAEFEKQWRMSLIQYALNCKQQADNKTVKDSSSHLKKYGIIDIFVPEINNERNTSKRLSLQQGKNIKLIAHSCYSYFDLYGNRFRDIVEQKLKDGYSFFAIASNPWSESSLFASLEEVYDRLSDYEYIGKDGIRYMDCIRIIEDSQCYKVKYRSSIRGYLSLKKKYGDNIQLRLTKYEMMSTILLTENECYMEPYLPVNLEERYNKGMLTFELKVNNTSYLYRHNKKYFDFLWNLSEDYETYCSHVEKYKERLRKKTPLEIIK